MNFEDENEKQNIQERDDIKVIYGDHSNLDISSVGNYLNGLRPKSDKKKKKGIVIPKTKNDIQ